MNYLKHYKQLIRKATIRQENNPLISYKEKHHIIPKCFLKHKPKSVWNGSWNIVELTAREHFIAHMLLWFHYKKEFGSSHPKSKKMLYAWSMFFKDTGGRKFNSYQYEFLRKQFSKNISGVNNPMYGKVGTNKGKVGKLSHLYGKKRPKHSKWMKENAPNKGKRGYWAGKVGPNSNKKMPEETKNKISVSLKSKDRYFWTNEKRRKKISDSLKGRSLSAEHKAELSKSKYGKPNIKKRKSYTVIYNNGTSEAINGFNQFCSDRGLNKSSLHKLMKGEINIYKNIVKIIRKL